MTEGAGTDDTGSRGAEFHAVGSCGAETGGECTSDELDPVDERGSADRPAAEDSLPADAKARRRWGLGTIVRVGFLVLVTALIAVWVWNNRAQVMEGLRRITFWPMFATVVVALFGAWTGAPAWRTLLAGVGNRLRWSDAQRVYFLGQLGKYIPGGVWSVLAQATMAKDLHVPRTRSAAASLVTVIVSVVTAAVGGALLLLVAGRDVLGEYGWLLLLVLPLLVLLHPAVLEWALALVARITRRQISVRRIHERFLAGSAAWLLAGQLVAGLQIYWLAGMIGGIYPNPLRAIGLFMLAGAFGILIFIAPAGVGVRELVLVFGLSPVMDSGTALLVALMSRLVTLAADVLLAAVAAAVVRRAVPGPAPDGAPSGGP